MSLPGCGCRGAFQVAVMKRLAALGETFDVVAGASSGSITGAVWVAGLAEEAPEFWRALARTPIFSRRYFKTERSPFGMSHILRDALQRYVPEQLIGGTDAELIVSTTRARRLVRGALGLLRPRTASHGSDLATSSRIRSMAVAKDALVVHSNRERSDMHDVIVASCTIPGVYARLPVLDGEIHVDGGAADNTLIEALLARGVTDLTVVSPYRDGAVSPTLFERERPPTVPPGVRLRLIWPERTLRIGRFDFDHERLEEALTMPHVERVFDARGSHGRAEVP
ncbi:MAG: patatin-like phospholipase family protein [Polyangiaceae bacterium]